ncbi:MAG: hypothetical protein RLZZ292_3825, partial [Bacteroidota bacterium]
NKNLSATKKTASSNKNEIIRAEKQEIHIGPIPSPDTLRQYEELHPGLAERFMQMAENEQKKRHDNDTEIIQLERERMQTEKEIGIKNINNIARGQWMSIFSVILIVGLCAYMAYLGDTNNAKNIALGVIVALAGVFVLQKTTAKKEDK